MQIEIVALLYTPVYMFVYGTCADISQACLPALS